jgi:hypothetical protein
MESPVLEEELLAPPAPNPYSGEAILANAAEGSVVGAALGLFASTLFPQDLLGAVETATVGLVFGLCWGGAVGFFSAVLFGRRPTKETAVPIRAIVGGGVVYSLILWSTRSPGLAVLATLVALAGWPFLRGWAEALLSRHHDTPGPPVAP